MKRFLLTSLLILSAMPALAQSYSRVPSERMDRIERDLQILQRQIARGGAGGSSVTVNSGDVDTETRLSAMEEDIRALRGKAEENEFQIKQLTETLEKFQKDTEFRFNEMSPQQQTQPNAPDAPPPATAPQQSLPQERKPLNLEGESNAPPARPTTAGDGILHAPEEKAATPPTPRDHYDYAFRLLNQTKYSESAEAFESFVKKYPKDPLVGNAYYWLGETYYIRRDYIAAADSFRQGFEILPGGPKAADNLLKLAMSLNALGRDKEACIVLGQVTTKFKKSSTSITAKAEQEKKRIGCK